jgi:OOP family OmpA-OmpF porin
MHLIKAFLIFVGVIYLSSCSASYETLTKTDFNPKYEISKYLLLEYKEKAIFEAEKMHDWDSAKLYSEKALGASQDKKILPQNITYWKIPADKRFEIIKGYNNLMSVYEETLSLDPYNLAKAISSLDCWSEQQEENWQTWDINKCRDDFLKAMHNLYDSVSKNQKTKEENIDANTKKVNDSATVVVQDNENILQIIYFDFDKSKLSDVSINKIRKFVKINKNKIKEYIVVGHTDTKGSKDYNQILSNERAKTVKLILIELGINSNKIKVMGKGENSLRVQTEDEIEHPANRRAEISPLK